MASVSLQVIDGVDKGRSFGEMPTPVTIGREEGNTIRLNDDRVSRFHAKIQEDRGHLVLTDLDSTNGTRVNGETIQLRLLRPGDRVSLGRSTLVFGSMDEISANRANVDDGEVEGDSSATYSARADLVDLATDLPSAPFFGDSQVDVFTRTPPSVPERLSPAQAAQLSELIDFLHRALADATDSVRLPPKSSEARLPKSSWQRIQMVQLLLAQYSRKVAEPPPGETPH